MKRIIFKATTALCLAAAITGCSDEPTKTKNEQVNSLNETTDAEKLRAEEVEAFKKENSEKIAANEKVIADLKARVNISKQEARDNYNNKIEVLEKRNIQLKEKLGAFQEKSAENWNEFKNEFNHDMHELGDAFEDFNKNNVK